MSKQYLEGQGDDWRGHADRQEMEDLYRAKAESVKATANQECPRAYWFYGKQIYKRGK